jgi:multisubunit Na+/H+ antiporter MnhB subunit
MTGKIIFGIFVGLAGGVATGAGFVAFLTVLGVIPRLTQLTKTMKMIHYYEGAIIAGVVAGTWLGLQETEFSLAYPEPSKKTNFEVRILSTRITLAILGVLALWMLVVIYMK